MGHRTSESDRAETFEFVVLIAAMVNAMLSLGALFIAIAGAAAAGSSLLQARVSIAQAASLALRLTCGLGLDEPLRSIRVLDGLTSRAAELPAGERKPFAVNPAQSLGAIAAREWVDVVHYVCPKTRLHTLKLEVATARSISGHP